MGAGDGQSSRPGLGKAVGPGSQGSGALALWVHLLAGAQAIPARG